MNVQVLSAAKPLRKGLVSRKIPLQWTPLLESVARHLPHSWVPFRKDLAEAQESAVKRADLDFLRSDPPSGVSMRLWGFQFVEAYFPEQFERVVPRLRNLLPFLDEEEHRGTLDGIIALQSETRASSTRRIGVLVHGDDQRHFMRPKGRLQRLPAAVDYVEVIVVKPLPSMLAIAWIVRLRSAPTEYVEALHKARPAAPLEYVRLLWRDRRLHLGGYHTRSAAQLLQERVLDHRRDLQGAVQEAVGLAKRRGGAQLTLHPAVDIFTIKGLSVPVGLELFRWWREAQGWFRTWGVESHELHANDNCIFVARGSRDREMRQSLVVRSNDGDLSATDYELLPDLAPSLCVLGMVRDLHERYVALRGAIRRAAEEGRHQRLSFRQATELGVSVTWCATAAEILKLEYDKWALSVTGRLRDWHLLEVKADAEPIEDDRVSRVLDERIRWELDLQKQHLDVLQRWWTTHMNAVATTASAVASRRAVWLGALAILITVLQFEDVRKLLSTGVDTIFRLLRR